MIALQGALHHVYAVNTKLVCRDTLDVFTLKYLHVLSYVFVQWKLSNLMDICELQVFGVSSYW